MCDVSAGRLLSCKDAIGGLLNVYFVNYQEVVEWSMDALTEIVASYVPATTPPPPNGPLADAWKYELHLGNDLTQNINASPENGTLYFEQVLSLTLKKLTANDNVQIRNLAAGRPYVLVEDQMGNVWLCGRINGMDVTGGTAVTGNDFGDLNGYTLTFTGKEQYLANLYTGDIAAEFNVNGIIPTP
jgi:hypothetical protein